MFVTFQDPKSKFIAYCKSLIRPILTYNSITVKKDEEDLKRFELTILRKIFGTVKDEDGVHGGCA